jgi:integrase/recombinase XerD
MATVNAILWPRKDSDGKHPIKIRITKDKKSKYIPVGLSVKKADWNPKESLLRSTVADYDTHNDTIRDLIKEAESAEKKTRSFEASAEVIYQTAIGKNPIKGHAKIKGKTDDFFIYAQNHIDRLENAKQHRTARNIQGILNKMKEYWERPTLPFTLITVSFLKDLESYLIGTVENKRTTISKNLERIRKVLNEAVTEGIIEVGENPFYKYKIKHQKTNKEKLSTEEIKKLFNLTPLKGSRKYDALNVFKFQFYSGGIRIGDCLMMKWKNITNGRIQFETEKTSKLRSHILVKPALEVLKLYRPKQSKPDYYIFPFLNHEMDYSNLQFLQKQIEAKTALINKYLKELATLAKIDKNLSTHIARHSMADYLRKSGQSIYDISKILGHSSIKITESYLSSLDQESVDESMEVLGKI